MLSILPIAGARRGARRGRGAGHGAARSLERQGASAALAALLLAGGARGRARMGYLKDLEVPPSAQKGGEKTISLVDFAGWFLLVAYK